MGNMVRNDGRKKTKQICVRVTEGALDTLKMVIDRVVERSNGLAEPEISAIVMELMRFSPKRFVEDDDREFVKSRMEAGHPPIPAEAEDESPVKKGKRDVA